MWKTNVTVYWLGQIYYVSRVYMTFGTIPMSLLVSVVFSCVCFYCSCSVLNTKLENLHRIMLYNEKLLQEMSTTFGMFPNGMIIQDQELKDDKLYMVNKYFKEQICELSENVNSLKEIKILCVDKDAVEKQISSDLFTLLQDQASRVEDKKVAKNLVRITCLVNQETDVSLESESDEYLERTFTIKTMKINWHGKASLLHVFIDNTDVVKLEQANSNIKYQKTMFASASHEFRTPLNAIMYSYNYVRDTLNVMKHDLVSMCGSSKIEKQFVGMFKFLKMGYNSSVLLLALIDDILALSTIEAGTFSV